MEEISVPGHTHAHAQIRICSQQIHLEQEPDAGSNLETCCSLGAKRSEDPAELERRGDLENEG